MSESELDRCCASAESFVTVLSYITLFWDVLLGVLVGLEMLDWFHIPVFTLVVLLISRAFMSFCWLLVANAVYVYVQHLTPRKLLVSSPGWYLFVLLMYCALVVLVTNSKANEPKPWWLIFAVVWVSHIDVFCRTALAMIVKYKLD